jgi:hypothetical protein
MRTAAHRKGVRKSAVCTRTAAMTRSGGAIPADVDRQLRLSLTWASDRVTVTVTVPPPRGGAAGLAVTEPGGDVSLRLRPLDGASWHPARLAEP